MTLAFVQSFRARWVDMDFNQHMRNAAFLGYAEDTRMLFLESRGFTMVEFGRLQIGPVVLEDRLSYRRELKLLEPFSVDLQLVSMSPDGARLRVRNRFLKEDGGLAAQVDSLVVWFDLSARKPVAPPEALRAAWAALSRSDDFVEWPADTKPA